MLKSLNFAAAAGFLAAPALAADLSIVEPLPLPEEPKRHWGYVDLRAGYHQGDGTFIFRRQSHYSWDGFNVAGAARAAFMVSPHWSSQFDIWANNRDFESDEWEYGGAAHLTWLATEGHRFGGMVSVGAESDNGNYVALAVEGAHDYGAWRFHGQAGYIIPISGQAKMTDETAWYARGVVGYYFNPNLYTSGNLGYQDENWDNGSEYEVTWGANIEFKHDDSPLSGYLAYYGEYMNGRCCGDISWRETEHVLAAGIRIHFQDATLQEINRNVGLIDMNPYYGEYVLR